MSNTRSLGLTAVCLGLLAACSVAATSESQGNTAVFNHLVALHLLSNGPIEVTLRQAAPCPEKEWILPMVPGKTINLEVCMGKYSKDQAWVGPHATWSHNVEPRKNRFLVCAGSGKSATDCWIPQRARVQVGAPDWDRWPAVGTVLPLVVYSDASYADFELVEFFQRPMGQRSECKSRKWKQNFRLKGVRQTIELCYGAELLYRRSGEASWANDGIREWLGPVPLGLSPPTTAPTPNPRPACMIGWEHNQNCKLDTTYWYVDNWSDFAVDATIINAWESGERRGEDPPYTIPLEKNEKRRVLGCKVSDTYPHPTARTPRVVNCTRK